MRTVTLNDQLWDRLNQAVAPMSLCYQCGVCTAVCPLHATGKPPSVRKLVGSAQAGFTADSNDAWLCTTCKLCEFTCPRGVPVVDVIHALRTIAFSEHKAPPRLEEVLWKVYESGNPWGEGKAARTKWTDGLNVRDALEGVDVLLYIGCASSYDPRLQNVAKSVLSLLKAADINFGVLKTEEKCCGDAVYQTGEEGYFEELVAENIATFSKTKASVIVSISPHCFNMFKTIYPKYGATFRAVHYTELLADLVDDGKLRLTEPVEDTVTYHDPCYLSRYHGIQEQPRKILESIRGIELVEMRHSGENTFCCGGGGGRVFLEGDGQRLADIRVREAADTGAQTLATSCPYCIQNFEDSLKTTGNGLRVLDVAELMAKSAKIA
jgi:Fe-S oxidoreductase